MWNIKILLIFIFIYCFVGDFLIATTHLYSIRLFSFLGIILFFPMYFIQKKDKKIIKLILFISANCFVYYIIRLDLEWISFFYTILLGYILSQNRKQSIFFLDFIFYVQFLLISIELITQNFFYTTINSGIYTIREYDFSQVLYLQEETGMRPKGLFSGTLIATSFVIYYCLINRENKRKVLFSLFMALILNGRLAILITAFISFLHYKNNFSLKKIQVFIFCTVFILGFSILYQKNDNIRMKVDRFFNVFNLTQEDNVGRIYRYSTAYDTYINKYGIKSKMFGDQYELTDTYNRPVAAESDLLGMLLEIGLLGTLIYIFSIYKLFKLSDQDKIVTIKYVGLLTLVTYLQYRHITGNVRGTLFWMMYFLSIKESLFFGKNFTNKKND